MYGRPTHPGLELVARCVIETGTATYCASFAAHSDEPVLRGIAARICADEVSHYKHFYRYFRKYRRLEDPGRYLSYERSSVA